MPRPAFPSPILPPPPAPEAPAANLHDKKTVGLLLDESTRLRIQLAQRPTRRADLEEALLDICLAQAHHVQDLQRQRERTLHAASRESDVYLEAALERQNKTIHTEAATLVRLVRAYRLFIPTESADPANYAHLFNPFLDWLERPEVPPDQRERTHALITAFVESLPRRTDFPGAPPPPEPEAFVPLY